MTTKKTKIEVFKSPNSEMLAKKINDSEKDFFASQIFRAESVWVCFAYFKE